MIDALMSSSLVVVGMQSCGLVCWWAFDGGWGKTEIEVVGYIFFLFFLAL